jgi:hypothetical protein
LTIGIVGLFGNELDARHRTRRDDRSVAVASRICWNSPRAKVGEWMIGAFLRLSTTQADPARSA